METLPGGERGADFPGVGWISLEIYPNSICLLWLDVFLPLVPCSKGLHSGVGTQHHRQTRCSFPVVQHERVLVLGSRWALLMLAAQLTVRCLLLCRRKSKPQALVHLFLLTEMVAKQLYCKIGS